MAETQAGRIEPPGVSDGRERFDAALVPGMRERLAEAYGAFRLREAEAIEARALLTEDYRDRDCPICNATFERGRRALDAHGLTLLDCPDCGLTYSRGVMPAEQEAAMYRSVDPTPGLAPLRLSEPYLELETARAGYYLARLGRHVSPGALLEIGSGFGTFLLEAQRAGWRPLGIEPGAGAAAASRDRGARVVEGYFPQDLPDPHARFAAIAVLDVLEHMADPLAFLAAIRERLAPGGRLFVQVPNWDSLLVRLEGADSAIVCPGHWSYFTPDSLRTLAARAGFRAVEIDTVQSEIDRQAQFPPAEVGAMLARLRPGERGIPGPDRLHTLLLGYKLIGIFAPDDSIVDVEAER